MNVNAIILSFTVVTLCSPSVVRAATANSNGLDCIIEPSSVVNVGSEVAGIIEHISVDRGDTAHKGQVLVRLDSKVEWAVMESKKARYEFARNEHLRRSGLYAKALIATRDFDESETNLKIAQREFEEAEKVYERRTIVSPIDGVVVQRLLQPGERVETQPILKLAQLSPLYVEVIAPAGMLGSVKTGDRVAVKPEEPVTREYVGRVKVVDNVLDAASGTFGIRIELANADHSLPSGLKCRARFLEKGASARGAVRSGETSAEKAIHPKSHAPAPLKAVQPFL